MHSCQILQCSCIGYYSAFVLDTVVSHSKDRFGNTVGAPGAVLCICARYRGADVLNTAMSKSKDRCVNTAGARGGVVGTLGVVQCICVGHCGGREQQCVRHHVGIPEKSEEGSMRKALRGAWRTVLPQEVVQCGCFLVVLAFHCPAATGGRAGIWERRDMFSFEGERGHGERGALAIALLTCQRGLEGPYMCTIHIYTAAR